MDDIADDNCIVEVSPDSASINLTQTDFDSAEFGHDSHEAFNKSLLALKVMLGRTQADAGPRTRSLYRYIRESVANVLAGVSGLEEAEAALREIT